jgi:XTP/dITP diphosphohydrolase
MKKLIVASGNKNKLREIEQILNVPLEAYDLNIDEVQSMDLEYVCKRKTESAFKIIKAPLIVDDVGVFIESLNNFPGPFAKYIQTEIGIDNFLKLLKNEKNRNMKVKCAVGYHDGKKARVFIGVVKGKLAFEQKGNNGWGFDPIFIPSGQSLTFAQMEPEEKNIISHRAKAFLKLSKFLDSQKTQKEL